MDIKAKLDKDFTLMIPFDAKAFAAGKPGFGLLMLDENGDSIGSDARILPLETIAAIYVALKSLEMPILAQARARYQIEKDLEGISV